MIQLRFQFLKLLCTHSSPMCFNSKLACKHLLLCDWGLCCFGPKLIAEVTWLKCLRLKKKKITKSQTSSRQLCKVCSLTVTNAHRMEEVLQIRSIELTLTYPLNIKDVLLKTFGGDPNCKPPATRACAARRFFFLTVTALQLILWAHSVIFHTI